MAIQIDLLIKLLKPANCIQETTRSWVLPKSAAVHHPKLFMSNLVYWLNAKVCCLGSKEYNEGRLKRETFSIRRAIVYEGTFCSTSLGYAPTGFADSCFVQDGFAQLPLSTN